MGWVLLALLGGIAIAALWLLRVARGLLVFVASALMLGAAGYAWQQHAGLPGHPVAADSHGIEVSAEFVAFRGSIMPGRPGDSRIFEAADGRLKAGDTEAAARVMLEAIKVSPDDAALWTGLGTVLVAHDEGRVSPAASFAFRRAEALGPTDPGPPFFLGLAYAQGNDLATAKPAWERALARTPRDASYLDVIVQQIEAIDKAMQPDPIVPPPPAGNTQN